MAGNCKPIQAKSEAKFKVLSMRSNRESGGTIYNCGLFNGIITNEWNTPDVFL